MTSVLNERHLFLSGEITTSLVKPLIESILKLNLEDDKKEREIVDYQRPPIHLTIDSVGGSVYAGLALINAMEISKTPVHTFNIGMAASMAFAIFVAGDLRHTARFSTFMFHDISYGAFGTFEENTRTHIRIGKLKEYVINFILERTDIRKEELEAYEGRVEDWHLDSQEALKLRVANVEVPNGRGY